MMNIFDKHTCYMAVRSPSNRISLRPVRHQSSLCIKQLRRVAFIHPFRSAANRLIQSIVSQFRSNICSESSLNTSFKPFLYLSLDIFQFKLFLGLSLDIFQFKLFLGLSYDIFPGFGFHSISSSRCSDDKICNLFTSNKP